MQKSFIAYTRVSTTRQGTEGVSLHEQRRAIKSYAAKHRLNISAWYVEQSSAAKQGRPVFDQVMEELCVGDVGLILHKIDRGARNLRDWASIGEAIDLGVDVRFAHDDLDMSTRGGRLAADIQAVIAADYIRNLREEVKKGIEGRLRQGLYPLPAPRGYVDRGSGRAKQPDPIIAPLIIAAFERYATGNYTYKSLASELALLGLTNRHGRPLKPDAIAHVLANPFYIGCIKLSGQVYRGVHQPLIDEELFNRVQVVRRQRSTPKQRTHRFRYQRRLRCNTCQRFLTGERQKQHVYYRCHHCPGVSVREDRVASAPSTTKFQILDAPKDLLPYAKFEKYTPLTVVTLP
ncbi:recombinase family protein [Tateyamaria sp. SN3-11]|uniref:recombinase family protein n=1 Tax=Tateyamaria sp. SN3-11 TaxID=3092147 RepID=UPI0039E7F9BC